MTELKYNPFKDAYRDGIYVAAVSTTVTVASEFLKRFGMENDLDSALED